MSFCDDLEMAVKVKVKMWLNETGSETETQSETETESEAETLTQYTLYSDDDDSYVNYEFVCWIIFWV